MDENKTTHRYYFINRPPMYGTLPTGFDQYEQWMPTKLVTMPDGWKRDFFGWADYSTRLSVNQIYGFELAPEDPAEYAFYILWNENNRSLVEAIDDIRYCDDVSDSDLAELAKENNRFWAILYFRTHDDALSTILN